MKITKRLIGLGACAAKKAVELEKGDVVIYNYGETAVFQGFAKIMNKTLVLSLVSSSGELYERRLGKDTLVATS